MSDIKSMILNVISTKIILPYSAIAKVDRLKVDKKENANYHWLYGFIKLNNEQVPLLAIDELLEGHERIDISPDNQRVAILNKPFSESKYNFIAILLSAVPKLVRIEEEEFEFFEEYNSEDLLHSAKLNWSIVYLLNLPKIFKLVEKVS